MAKGGGEMSNKMPPAEKFTGPTFANENERGQHLRSVSELPPKEQPLNTEEGTEQPGETERPSDRRLRKVLDHIHKPPENGVSFVGGLYGSADAMTSHNVLAPTLIEREQSRRLEAALAKDVESGKVIVIDHGELVSNHVSNSLPATLRYIHKMKTDHPEAKIVVNSPLALKDVLSVPLQEAGHEQQVGELLGMHGAESKQWLANWVKTGGAKEEGEPDPAPTEIEELFHNAFAGLKGKDGRLLDSMPLSFAVRLNDPISILLITYAMYGNLHGESLSLTKRLFEPKETSVVFVQIMGGKIGLAPQEGKKIPTLRRF